MTAFQNDGGFTPYHYIQHGDWPRYPFDLCGPFADEAEADAALERIAAVFPSAPLHIESGSFSTDNAPQMLAQANAAALQRLALLRD